MKSHKKQFLLNILLKITTILLAFFVLLFSFTKITISTTHSKFDQSLSLKDPKSLAVVGGSEKLFAIQHEAGADSQPWVAFNQEGDVTKKCTKKIEFTTAKTSDQITIDDRGNGGFVVWHDKLESGEYRFKVCYTTLDFSYEGYSPEILLSVNPTFYFVEGNKNLVGEYSLAGHDKKRWSLIYRNVDVTLQTKMDLINAPAGVSISNDGLISWDGTIASGDYAFKIKFNYEIPSQKFNWEGESGEIYLSINNSFHISGGSKNLTANVNKKGSDISRWAVYFDNENVTTLSNLTLINNPQGASIDKNGLVMWDNTLSPGSYYFQIKATYYTPKEYLVYSEWINLEVKADFFVDGGSVELKSNQAQSNEDNKTWIAVFSNEWVDNVEWSIVGSDSKNISIKNGIVSWNKDLKPGVYSFVVQAKYNFESNDYFATSPVILLTITQGLNSSQTIIIACSVTGSVLLISLVAVCIIIYKRKH